MSKIEPLAICEEKILNDRFNFSRSYVVRSCPYCGKTHYHGGGRPDEPSDLGLRSADCGKGGYYLALKTNPIIEEPKFKCHLLTWLC